MNATPLFVSFPNPEGIVSSSPGLRGTSYPGLMERDASTPTGLCRAGRATGPNPFRVDDVCFTIPQGSSFLATLGFMTESLWDSLTGAWQARDLEQTIAGSLPLPVGEDRDEGSQRMAEILEA
jgi:hypothetical protein